MWACERTTAFRPPAASCSGVSARCALMSAASARRPWNRPQSSRIFCPAHSKWCDDPVTVWSAPQKCKRIAMRSPLPMVVRWQIALPSPTPVQTYGNQDSDPGRRKPAVLLGSCRQIQGELALAVQLHRRRAVHCAHGHPHVPLVRINDVQHVAGSDHRRSRQR